VQTESKFFVDCAPLVTYGSLARMSKKIRFPSQSNRKSVLANREDPPIDALARKNPPPIDLLQIREEIVEYLESGTSMDQIDIAGLVGIRRETISAIKMRRAALTNIVDLHRLYSWMHIDRERMKG
jgi:hypothetical protein